MQDNLGQLRARGADEEDIAAFNAMVKKAEARIRDVESKMNPTRPFDKVKQFHEKYGQPVGDEPRFLSPERQQLREALIDEEVEEFKQAVRDGDLLNAFKELADIIYVVEGTAVEMGGDLDKVVSEVHLSNMSKLDENNEPIFREDGKVLKGENYQPPDIKKVLGL